MQISSQILDEDSDTKISSYCLVNQMDRSSSPNGITRMAMVEYQQHELEYIKILVANIVESDDKQVTKMLQCCVTQYGFNLIILEFFVPGELHRSPEPCEQRERSHDAQQRCAEPPAEADGRALDQEDKQA